MGRPLRIEFPGAIYHVMSRGNARQRIFRDARDYERLCEGLEQTVDRFGFEIFSFVCMPNHLPLLFRTPEPNLYISYRGSRNASMASAIAGAPSEVAGAAAGRAR